MAEIEIGIGKAGRRAFGFDDIAIVPSRRTRDPEDVDISCEIDAYRFDLPLMAAAMDGVVSPATATEIGRLGGVAVLNLEGLWTRYDDPETVLDEIATLEPDKATLRMQQVYAEPINEELIGKRIREIKDSGVISCASVTPQRTQQFTKAILEAELDLLVIQGTVVSAEHVSKSVEPLNLKQFICELEIPVIVGGCASYQAALHLMRTGAVGVLVGVGPGQACTTRGVLGIGVPQATAIADAAGARMRHLDETGVYVQVIADGGMSTGGDVAKAIACGADAVMIGSPLAAAHEAPGRGHHWGMATFAGRGDGALSPAAEPPFDTVLVVDFGAQYAQLIARRVREAHVYSEIVPRNMPIAEMLARKPKGIIFSGGPKSVHVEGAPTIDDAVYRGGVPILGICYGAQLVAQQLGGEVARSGIGEYGRTALEVTSSSALFGELPLQQEVWMSHADSIVAAPAGFKVTARTDAVPVAALEDPDRRLYGVQFHPEVAHTPRGQELLKHFLYDVCGCRPTWTMVSIIEQSVEAIRAQ